MDVLRNISSLEVTRSSRRSLQRVFVIKAAVVAALALQCSVFVRRITLDHPLS